MLDIDECLMSLFYVVKRGEVYCAGPVSPTRNGNFADFQDLSFVLIPVYRFIVYPLARKHIPSLLKKIGAGLILCLGSTVINTAVTAAVYFSEQSKNITMPDTPQVSLYCTLAANVLNGFPGGRVRGISRITARFRLYFARLRAVFARFNVPYRRVIATITR